ncbi:helix-turn-helix domain-containing protein [Actinoallomurus purpureus]|uniref:helix-turn-helix domain-containing protein n=1 Tax=Actinoallomurus purpureus TaxID=478114 RepID=UPI0027E322D9|nr:helix-turn-helix transcriptional regulator [Actinoallomurus purpureus]
MNDRLRKVVTASGLDEVVIAARLGVDPKTVERWMAGRMPYPRYRRALANLLGIDEDEIWPRTKQAALPTLSAPARIQAAYAHRWAVPRQEWLRLFASAEREIGILVYAALFIAEDNGILRILTNRALAGVRIRILLGDPVSPQVAERGVGEGIGETIAAKVRNSLALFRPLAKINGVEIRLHRTTLYASIYRADDDSLINLHSYGAAASHAGPASSQGRGRRHGKHLPGQLRTRLVDCGGGCVTQRDGVTPLIGPRRRPLSATCWSNGPSAG